MEKKQVTVIVRSITLEDNYTIFSSGEIEASTSWGRNRPAITFVLRDEELKECYVGKEYILTLEEKVESTNGEADRSGLSESTSDGDPESS